MTDNLDDKLDNLSIWIEANRDVPPAVWEETIWPEIKSRIKRTFANEGFVQMAYNPVKQEVIGKPIADILVSDDCMTGQEWLSRFNDELKFLISRGDGETWMGWGCGEVREAAKRASDIE